MASPNLTTDCTATVKIGYGLTSSYDHDVTVFEDDASQSRIVSTTEHLNPIELTFENQSDSQKASFVSFLAARMADGAVFYWNDIRSGVSDIKVKFLSENGKVRVKYVPRSIRTWDWTCKLVRVIS